MNPIIFSGTFNPIHIAHLIIAETVRCELNADKIIFIPAFIPPHREDNLADPFHRLNMVKLAIKDNPYFELSDIEYKTKEKSYSFMTIENLYQQNSDIQDKINFIIGSDAFSLIDSWFNAEKLSTLVNFIIIQRADGEKVENIIKNVKIKNFDYTIINIPQMSISSSCIRDKIKNKKSIKYLVVPPVEEYIYSNKLYKE